MSSAPGVAPGVYRAIGRVQAALAKSGIAKDRKNQQQGYQFRGIDDVYNALAPLLSEHGLCVLPRMLSRECHERQAKGGGALFSVTVEAEFDFVAVEDGTAHVVKTYGEAMDSGDKATNKAMSAAYKYALIQSFAIPTEGDNDADAQTHEVAAHVTPQVVADAQRAAAQAHRDGVREQAAAKPDPKMTGEETVWDGVGVRDVKVTEGVKDGRPWKRFNVAFDREGAYASTFSQTLGELAQQISETGEIVDATVRPAKVGKGFDLLKLEVVL